MKSKQQQGLLQMNSEQQQAIASLRALNLSPKQIARKLGYPPALVTAVIKQQAEQAAIERAAAGELEPVVECLVNADCVRTLLPNTNGRSNNLVPSNAPNQASESFTGLALVAVTRSSAYNRFSVCTYYWERGIVNTPNFLKRALGNLLWE
jgi:mRNA-degrading endonuclease toxin of MazEF toxin-antitoxin module